MTDTPLDLLLAKLAKLDSCAVSDALDKLQSPGAVVGITGLSAPRRIVGRAVTVQTGAVDGAPPKRHLCTAAVDSAGPGQIIVIAHDGRLDIAGWGGTLSLGAKQRGVEGVIIDGACRDLDESNEFDLPIYGRGSVQRAARGRVKEIDWNIPVVIAGVSVKPDDLVIADTNGIVFIPSALAEAAIEIGERVIARERLMAEAVRAGKPMVEVMGGDYESMLNNPA
jgi:4-hydroxy-4-methyl-2-oxoglutarate aldolase